MSSRNRYLDATRRVEAATLYQALCTTLRAFEGGARKADALEAGIAALSSRAHLDYLEVVDAATFEPIEELRPPAFIIGAARFGTTRLIDNLWVPLRPFDPSTSSGQAKLRAGQAHDRLKNGG
jgi:pantoate--beta-alanine ligase